MKIIRIGVTNRIYLETERTVNAVLITIVNNDGTYVKLVGDTEIKDLTCSLDAESGKYYYDVNLHADTVPDYYFIYWSASYAGINVNLEDELTPEDISIQANSPVENLLVPVSYVMDQCLRGIEISTIESYYQTSYRTTIRQQIKAATDQLETATEVYFQKKLIENERHDYDMTPIYEKYWTNTLYHTPIYSIEKVGLKLNEIEVIAEIPSGWVQIGNALEGVIKIMPYSGSYNGLMFIYTVGVGIAILLAGSSYIPDFFSYDYYAGLDWDNIEANEKEMIRYAISRRVAINMLPNLDVHRGLSSESKSIDGASKSTSYTSSATFGEHSAAIENYRKEDAAWIQSFKKKYLTRLKVC